MPEHRDEHNPSVLHPLIPAGTAPNLLPAANTSLAPADFPY
jgi:hypothetical protein